MARYKITFFIQIQRHSFTESWSYEAVNQSVNDIVPLCRTYCQARALTLGAPCYIYAYRISDLSDAVDRSLLVYETFLGVQTKDQAGNFVYGAAASNVALNCLFQNANGTKEKTIQMRGIWDAIEVEGGAALQTNPEWQTVWTNWANKVVQLKFGWLGKSGQTVSNLASYAIKDNGVLDFQFVPGFFNLQETPIGTHVPIRLRGMVDSPNLNGPLTVIIQAADRALSLKPIAAFPWISSGQAVRNTQSFYAAASARIQRLGKRQAGAPLLQSVGRGRNRIRG